jgi:DNA-binding NtrC family response regulator
VLHPVLCVDDDQDVLEVLELTAPRRGFEVVRSLQTTHELREEIEQVQPDVVVLDHELDERCWGLEMVELVSWTAPHAVIAMFSIRAGLDTAARNAGCHVYVEKPDVDGLWSAVGHALHSPRPVLDLRDDAPARAGRRARFSR